MKATAIRAPRRAARYGAALTLLGLLWLPIAGRALTLLDDAGQTVTLPRTPTRIVSLAPGATEMLFAAGAGSHVIATVQYSDEPQAARAVPRIGDSNAVDLERLLTLHPDVVVFWPAGNSAAQVEKIRALHIPLYRQQINALADIAPSLRRLGALADSRVTADAAARAIESELEMLRARFAARRRVRVLLQVWDHPIYTIGGTQPLSDALQICGAENVFADLREAGPAVTVEAVVARNPDAIIAAAASDTARAWLAEWRRFPSLRAVATESLLPLADPRLTRLGPSVLPATQELCALIEQVRSR
ncbi:MAG TPA: helical backbone metal receptor [Steroidobacteraceae bacterium]|nr:helical backbone metal receptor [Steroidobacteraceae bacterium]